MSGAAWVADPNDRMAAMAGMSSSCLPHEPVEGRLGPTDRRRRVFRHLRLFFSELPVVAKQRNQLGFVDTTWKEDASPGHECPDQERRRPAGEIS